MVKKLILIFFILIFNSFLARAQKNLEFSLGFGLKNEPGPYNRYRASFGLNIEKNLLPRDNTWILLIGENEWSYLWHDYKERKDVSDQYLRILLDGYPLAGLSLTETVTSVLGTGITLGGNLRNYKNSSMDYEEASRAWMYGVNFLTGLTLSINKTLVEGAIKYRYLIEDYHQESQGFLGRYDSNEKHHVQSLNVMLSIGPRLENAVFNVGIQLENWVRKRQQDKTWPAWPRDWDYLIFLKMSYGV